MAGSEQIQAARRQFEEIWSKGTLDVVEEIMSDDFVRHGPDLEGGQISGLEGFKGLVTLFRTGLPDMEVPVDEMHEIGDRVIVRWRVVGTNPGLSVGL
ncbi:MAG: ester cyclase [Pseudonocardiales bacterium]|nr:ester cyclase [Pseudonocardiales bacterium]